MYRRDFVKILAAVPVTAKMLVVEQAQAAPQAQAMAPASGSRQGAAEFDSSPIISSVPDLVAETEAHFFNDMQMATLRKLCGTFMPPRNGYPGALEAGVPEFLDFLIGASPMDRQTMYRSGLDRLNVDAQKHFQVPFAQANATQTDTLLRPWLKAWPPDHPPPEPYAHFINVAHHEIRVATMNSQAWSLAATSAGERQPGMGLYWFPVDPDIQRYV